MKISILIPCYNAAPYVGAALDSVLAQEWPDLEVIVVDDGSTDGSIEILERYQSRGITVLAGQGGCAARARNLGFEISSGEAILFLDADDVMGLGHLPALAERLEDGCVAFSRWDRFRVELTEAIFPSRSTESDLQGIEWILRDWQHGRSMTQPGMFLIPRQLIEDHGGWDERLSLIDDFEFYTRMILKSAGMRFSPRARLYYRSGIGDSLSGQRSRRAVESQALSLELGTGHLLAAEDSARTRRAAANMLQSFDYEHYPQCPDLRARLRRQAKALGGADIVPSGPPNFHRLRRLVGWKAARRIQRLAGR